jgi:hypothetical protein
VRHRAFNRDAEALNLASPVDLPMFETVSGTEHSDSANPIPGTLQIDILSGTGTPVLSPLPSENVGLIIDNRSGGQMGVSAATPAGTIAVVVPNGGTAGIVLKMPGQPAEYTVSVQELFKITVPNPMGGLPQEIYAVRRRVLLDSTSDQDAVGAPGNGRHSIDLSGTFH